jgi:hypothetical protein
MVEFCTRMMHNALLIQQFLGKKQKMGEEKKR